MFWLFFAVSHANDRIEFYATIAYIQIIFNLSFNIALLYSRPQPVQLEDRKAK